MTDPNAIYKTGFAELVVKLGRTPTMKDAELLGLHEAYKKSWEPAAETVLPPARVKALSPRPTEPTRQAWADRGATGAPDKPAEPEEPVSEPEPPVVNSGASEPVLVVASAPCRACGREFERVARRGRPPVKCEECR